MAKDFYNILILNIMMVNLKILNFMDSVYYLTINKQKGTELILLIITYISIGMKDFGKRVINVVKENSCIKMAVPMWVTIKMIKRKEKVF